MAFARQYPTRSLNFWSFHALERRVRDAESQARAEQVQHGEDQADRDAASDARLQLEGGGRLDAVDPAEIEEHGAPSA
jgi:hypothetical protein